MYAGDIGHFDENGSLYVVDRLKELLKFKGFQVENGYILVLLDFLHL